MTLSSLGDLLKHVMKRVPSGRYLPWSALDFNDRN